MAEGADHARARLTSANRVVIKLGTNVLTAGTDRLDLAIMASIVDQIAKLLAAGREVLVVSSGAVSAGRHILARHPVERRSLVPIRQILASIGQSRLMAAYDELFGWHDLVVAQALLTRADLADRMRYLNARTTLLSLLEHRVIPIINENDVVAVEELRDLSFGDNDALSAQVAALVDADVLLTLTDTQGLYTSDPTTNPDAELITYVPVIDESVLAMAGASTSGRGRGGMHTKLQAARLATAAGTSVVFVPGRRPGVIEQALAGEPVGTLFGAAETHLEAKKRWLLSGIGSKGSIVVDRGAAIALRQRGKSLLPAGILGVEGRFERGDTVNIMDQDGVLVGYGVSSYDAGDVVALQGCRSDQIADRIGYDYGAEIVHRNNLVIV